MTSLQPFHADEICTIALWNNVAIVDCGGDMDVDRMRRVGLAYRALAASHPASVLGLSFVRPETPVASAHARSEITQFLGELGDSLQHVAIVVEARGMLAQMMCSVIRGINVLARSSRLSVTSELDEAIAALVPLVQPPDAPSVIERELREAVEEARRRFERPLRRSQSA